VKTKTSKSEIISYAQILNVESFFLKDIPECIFAVDMGMSKEMAIKEIQRIYSQFKIHEIKFDIITMRHHFPNR
jgi:hypothetical protein